MLDNTTDILAMFRNTVADFFDKHQSNLAVLRKD